MTARLVLALLAASALQTAAAEAQPRRPFECKVLHPGDFEGREGVVRSPALVEGEGRPDCGGTCQIRIAFVYGDDVLDGPDDHVYWPDGRKAVLRNHLELGGYIEAWVDDASRIWQENGLDAELRFAGAARHPKLTGATSATKGGWEVHVQRFQERFGAYLVYAITRAPDEGRASAKGFLGLVAPVDRWRPSDPYQVLDWSATAGVVPLDFLSALPHEVGHNLGLHHDPATRAAYNEGQPVWRGGSGFAGGGIHTIMAYWTEENPVWIQRFSTSSSVLTGLGGQLVKGKKYPLGEKGVHESVEVLRWNIPRLAMLHEPAPEPPPDDPDPETDLILHGGRFTASIEVDPGDSRLRPARPVNVDLPGESSGLFYFFSADNAEVLFKVLNGCGVNGHWWVYTAAATDLYFELTVVDHERSTSKRYVSVGLPPPIADATAFPCSN